MERTKTGRRIVASVKMDEWLSAFSVEGIEVVDSSGIEIADEAHSTKRRPLKEGTPQR
jgi:hypothetical protein